MIKLNYFTLIFLFSISGILSAQTPDEEEVIEEIIITEVPAKIKTNSNSNIPTEDNILLNETIAPVTKVSIDEGTLLVYAMDGELSSYNYTNKTKNWSLIAKRASTDLGYNMFNLQDGVIYIPFRNGEIYALNGQNGKPFWKSKIGLKSDGRFLYGQKPFLSKNKVFVASMNNEIYALNANTGEMEWNYRLDYKFNIQSITGTQGMIFIPNAPYVYNFEMDTGKALFQRGFKRAMYSNPVTDGEAVYIANESTTIFALQPNDLDILWEFEIEDDEYNVDDKLAVENGSLYVGAESNDNKSSVYSLNSKTGNQSWKTEILGDLEHISLFENGVFGYNDVGLLFQLDKKTGEKLNEFQLGYIPISNLVQVDSNTLLYYSKAGIASYSIKTKKEDLVFPNPEDIKGDRPTAFIEYIGNKGEAKSTSVKLRD